jgi:hypothetical protein
MSEIILALICALIVSGCASFDVYSPGPDGEPEKIATAHVFGQGCAVAQQTEQGWEVLLQHSGMSSVLGGTLGRMISGAASVFGGSAGDPDPAEDRGGCEGVLSGDAPPPAPPPTVFLVPETSL